MRDVEKRVQEQLFSMQDTGYREFQSKLIPTVDPKTVIGVRTPDLRAWAKKFAKTSDAEEFLQILPHQYYEENNLHGFLIEGIKDYSSCLAALQRFLPYVDNWATCDLMAPRVFKKHLPELIGEIRTWIGSGHTYTIRFGLGMLMRFYLDEAFCPEYLELAAGVRSEEYYVNMMTAWYFATALAKQYEAAVPYIENCRLDVWTHNKTIQKAVESDRIGAGQKAYLRTLKIKKSGKPAAGTDAAADKGKGRD